MLPVKLRRRFEYGQDKPQFPCLRVCKIITRCDGFKLCADYQAYERAHKLRRVRRPQKLLLILILVAWFAYMCWLAATNLLAAIDHEIDRMPTAEAVVTTPVVVDEPEQVVAAPQPNPDRDLLAQVIYAEARGESFDGKVAVGAVILNRVADSRWPDTVHAVVHQQVNGRAQFAVADRTNPECVEAAEAALAGENPVDDAVYFYADGAECGWIRTREIVAQIGGHVFAR